MSQSNFATWTLTRILIRISLYRKVYTREKFIYSKNNKFQPFQEAKKVKVILVLLILKLLLEKYYH